MPVRPPMLHEAQSSAPAPTFDSTPLSSSGKVHDRARGRRKAAAGARSLLAVLVLGCAVADDGGQFVATSGATGTGITTHANSSDHDGDGTGNNTCEPGTAGCTCAGGGICIGGLVCASQTCVDLGGSSGADEGGTAKPMTDDGSAVTDGGDETAGSEEGSCAENCFGSSPHHGGLCFCDPTCATNDSCCPDYAAACPGQCNYNLDCDADEVCNSAQECVYAWGQTYEVCVDLWWDQSPTCWDVDECLADVYYEILDGGDVVFTSTTHDDVLSTSWPNCFAMEFNSNITDGTQSNRSWAIAFYDEDVGPDDGINSVCHVAGGGCSYLPLSYLKDGIAMWESGPGYPYSVWVRFVAL